MSIWLVTAITYVLGFGLAAAHAHALSLLVVVPVLLAPLFVLWRGVRKNLDRWTYALDPIAVEGAGAYRGQAVVPGFGRHIPLRVRLAALSCFCFGVQFVPGLALGIGGLFAAGLGLLSIPGLFVAHEMWRAGSSLLEASPLSLAQAMRAARAAQMLNVILVVGFGLGFFWSLAAGSSEVMVFVIVVFAMAAAALVQALWLGKVVESIAPKTDLV